MAKENTAQTVIQISVSPVLAECLNQAKDLREKIVAYNETLEEDQKISHLDEIWEHLKMVGWCISDKIGSHVFYQHFKP